MNRFIKFVVDLPAMRVARGVPPPRDYPKTFAL